MPPGRGEFHQPAERGARVRRVVQDARREHHVEGSQAANPGCSKSVSMNRTRSSPNRRAASAPSRKRRPRQVGADHDAVGVCQVQAHLPGPAADVRRFAHLRESPDRAGARRRFDRPASAAPAECRARGIRGTARDRRSGGPLRCARPREGAGLESRRAGPRDGRSRGHDQSAAIGPAARRAGEQLPERVHPLRRWRR